MRRFALSVTVFTFHSVSVTFHRMDYIDVIWCLLSVPLFDPDPDSFSVCPVDHVFEQILNSSSSELAEARQILRNIVCRRLYKCLGQTQADKAINVTQVCVCVFAWLHSNAHLTSVFVLAGELKGFSLRAGCFVPFICAEHVWLSDGLSVYSPCLITATNRCVAVFNWGSHGNIILVEIQWKSVRHVEHHVTCYWIKLYWLDWVVLICWLFINVFWCIWLLFVYWDVNWIGLSGTTFLSGSQPCGIMALKLVDFLSLLSLWWFYW